ncbi:hypothetical protein D3C71_1335570 [compost metagenome]
MPVTLRPPVPDSRPDREKLFAPVVVRPPTPSSMVLPNVRPVVPATVRSAVAVPFPRVSTEPDTAVKVLALPPWPSDTLPAMVPALTKLLPAPRVPEAASAMRPVIVPVLSLTKFT